MRGFPQSLRCCFPPLLHAAALLHVCPEAVALPESLPFHAAAQKAQPLHLACIQGGSHPLRSPGLLCWAAQLAHPALGRHRSVAGALRCAVQAPRGCEWPRQRLLVLHHCLDGPVLPADDRNVDLSARRALASKATLPCLGERMMNALLGMT